MIAKQVQGTNFKNVLDYVHKKAGAKLIGTNMTGKEPESLAVEFRISAQLRRRVTKCVYHVSLSVSKEEKLAQQQWIKIARAYLKGMEFDANQYAIYRHTDREHDHIHIIASRIRITDGSVVNDSWQYRRSEKLVRQLEQDFSLSTTQSSWEKRKRSAKRRSPTASAPTTGEIRQQRRTGELNKRSQLQGIIEQALRDRPSVEEFISRLRDKKVNVRLRKSHIGQIEGISYKFNGVAFQGRQLGKDYSWTSLKSVLATQNSHELTQDELNPQIEALTVVTNDSAELVPHPKQDAQSNKVQKPKNNNQETENNQLEQLKNYNQEVESDELEQQKKTLRDKYVHLASLVRQLPQFYDRETREIDIGVTLLSLKLGDDLQEAKVILTQSNQVKQWHQELPRETYLKIAREYILKVTNKATELIEENHLNQKRVELER
ncbi:relaxase/mobilization nuclease domain-containing protein [Gloeothece verrucosa]|uniref:Relaxase/mobilization nuclease family protein n=1 Tax=Gloeothece verrucosa (strain PCC 7822) TaxID=497965 RepID=E0UD79_GLOV7|nr:relaxase/mobilization nuclease domain-containing protein [Gloeothece verrucosa]ADN12959.1 Relaxase/mobilization nuclease family protein [Gloeothece verrucosa PCC 7822]